MFENDLVVPHRRCRIGGSRSGRDWFNWRTSGKRVLLQVDEGRAGQASGCNSGCGQCFVLLMRSWLAIAADSLIKVLFHRDRLLKGAGRTVRNKNDLVVPHRRCRISTCVASFSSNRKCVT